MLEVVYWPATGRVRRIEPAFPTQSIAGGVVPSHHLCIPIKELTGYLEIDPHLPPKALGSAESPPAVVNNHRSDALVPNHFSFGSDGTVPHTAYRRSATLPLELAPRLLNLVRHQVGPLVLNGVAAPDDHLTAKQVRA